LEIGTSQFAKKCNKTVTPHHASPGGSV